MLPWYKPNIGITGGSLTSDPPDDFDILPTNTNSFFKPVTYHNRNCGLAKNHIQHLSYRLYVHLHVN